MPDRLRITYDLTLAPGEAAEAKARDIAREQTVELPPGGAPAEVEARVVGSLESLAPTDRGRWRAVIGYDAALVGADVPQLLNLVFGNVSLKSGIRVTDLQLPAGLLDRFPGPRFGIAGLRERCGILRRPLLCAAAKPVGLSAPALAELCYRFARAGFDLVKDDHSVTDQETAPFRERVERCRDAVARANRETGGRTLYLPNVTGPRATLDERLDVARAEGCAAVLVNALPLGLDTLGAPAEWGLAAVSHPTFAGALFAADHGIAPHVLLGTLFRLAGSDAVIYPNVGGRFPDEVFSDEACAAIHQALRAPLGRLRPAFPVPGGGIEAARVPHWIERYGGDTIFLVGSSLYAQADLDAAARGLVASVRRQGA
ncbi:MAG: RuBisCO large subunit C-terminal-like domain-containing protein [Acidimicrobiales bacterium]